MDGRSTARAVAALIALSASTFLYVTTEMLPIGLLTLISDDLSASPSAVGMLVTGYGLMVVLATIPLTQLTRRVPRRLLMSGLLAVFVLAGLLSAAATDYTVLLCARIATALSQALFWAVVVPTATSMFPPRVHGRVISVVFAGSSLAAVLGVPAGIWLGQQAGWRSSFLALSAVGLLTLIVVASLVPAIRPAQGAAARGATPDARQYWLLMAMTTLATTGTFTAFTYVTPFLTEVGGFTAAAIGPLLLIRGIAGIAGVAIGGELADRTPRAALVVPVAVQAACLLGLYAAGDTPVAAAGLIALSGLAFSALTTALSTRVLQIAPRSVDLAAAGASTTVNIGITAGAFIGGILLGTSGIRSTLLVGGLLSLAALILVIRNPARPPAPEPASAPLPEPVTQARV
ncbi:MFS transporter [Sphaerisporangium melleum]|uniref:MFS transporter n=1 Tax=Sphaerisporangium melleum TaxID=321316 RepID=A0A917RHJ0_9ACTN|nr:MFS transporter [Sphaerisporangium melleum]GGL08231.1 MFS transporter [Sphaerisporangium melleum]GII74321.1 MFS transporter [Sphaerisporangium melleum]